jgi:hypothetical protein
MQPLSANEIRQFTGEEFVDERFLQNSKQNQEL